MAGGRRAHRGLADRARLAHRAHLEVVGHDHAAEAQLAAQPVADEATRERGGHAAGIELRIDRVRGHHRLDPRRDRLDERRQVGGAHLVRGRVDRGQLQVRVERRVTLAGEMLRARRQPGARHAADARDAVARHDLRILAVRADADVGAVALGQHVEARAEVQIDAEAAQLARLDQSLFVGEALLAGGPHREVVGKDRHAAAEHDDATAFVVGRHQQSPAEGRLERVEQRREPGRALEVAPIEDEAGRARVMKEADVGLGQLRAAQSDHHSLAHEVFDRHVPILPGGLGRAVTSG